MKKSRFLTNISLYLVTTQDRAIIYNGMRIGKPMPSSGTILVTFGAL